MKFDRSDYPEHTGMLMYRLELNEHGGNPFCIYKVSPESTEHLVHRHDFFQIYYVAQGKLRHLINDRESELTRGDLFVIPPYVPHSVARHEHERSEAVELAFKPEFIYPSMLRSNDADLSTDFMYIEPFMVSESQVRPRLNFAGKAETDVEHIMNELLYEFNEKKQGFALMIRSLILRLLALAGRVLADESNASGKVSADDCHRQSVWRVVQYIEEHYTEKIYLEDVVKVSLLGQTSFYNAFRNVTNKTFTRYLNELRVAKAKEFLKKTDIKIIDVCSKTGFENVTHFNRTFKQLTSMTPKEYKQVNRYGKAVHAGDATRKWI